MHEYERVLVLQVSSSQSRRAHNMYEAMMQPKREGQDNIILSRRWRHREKERGGWRQSSCPSGTGRVSAVGVGGSRGC